MTLGTRILRFGLPCVTTPTGLQGLDAAAGFMTGTEDPRGFADEVVRLLGDDAQWTRVSKASRDFIAAHYSTDALWAVLSRAMGAD